MGILGLILLYSFSEVIMNEQSNMPPAAEPAGMAGWFATWMKAATKPNEQTFAELAASAGGKATTAYLWVFIGSLVNFFLVSLVQRASMRQIFQQLGLGDQVPAQGLGASIISTICGAPIAAVVGVLVFAVMVAIVQWIAKMMGGRGSYEQLLYVFAAVLTPFYLINAVLSLLGAIPFVGLCFGIVSLVLALYILYLEVLAVKAVNQFGWGQAAGALLLPIVVIGCCIAVVAFGMAALIAPAVRETFNSIN